MENTKLACGIFFVVVLLSVAFSGCVSNEPEIQTPPQTTTEPTEIVTSTVPAELAETSTLPKATSTLPKATSTLPKATSTLPKATSTLAPVQTTTLATTAGGAAVGDFCGRSTNKQCSSDADCVRGGCSGEICQQKDEGRYGTPCVWNDCYNAGTYSLACKCVKGGCQWSK